MGVVFLLFPFPTSAVFPSRVVTFLKEKLGIFSLGFFEIKETQQPLDVVLGLFPLPPSAAFPSRIIPFLEEKLGIFSRLGVPAGINSADRGGKR